MSNPRQRPAQDSLTAPAVTVRMTEPEVRMMLLYLARSTPTLMSARQELTPELFSPVVEGGPLLFLTALYSYHDAYQATPPSVLLVQEVERAFARLGATLPAGSREWAVEAAQLVDDPGVVTAILANEQAGVDLLYRFLYERLVAAKLRHVISQTPGHLVLSNVAGVLSDMTGLVDRVQAVRTPSASMLFPDAGITVEMPDVIPTGVGFLDDDILEGGPQAGKVYALFGPWGSFKTGLAVQMAVSAAERQLASERPGLVVYFVYEGGEHEIRIRGIAAASDMPKRAVEDYFRGGGAGGILSTRTTLKEYETRRYDQAQTPPEARLGEYERMALARQRMTHLRIKDMSGPKDNPSAGSGYMPEVVATLDRITRESGLPIRMVIVDYAKRMAKRHLEAHKKRMDDLRHYVGDLPDLFRRHVAERFGCAVWLLQQLNPGANKKAPGAAQHHADSSEAGDFGENVWYAITLSSVDRANNHTVQVNATKVRDSAGPPTGIVTRIDGTRSKLVIDPDHVIGQMGRLVPRGLHQAFVGGAAPAATHNTPPAGLPNPADADG